MSSFYSCLEEKKNTPQKEGGELVEVAEKWRGFICGFDRQKLL